ncbi:MAG TPA: hypothetical protein VFW83_01235 [Bryobacteraceae bacterium]|nr:hypothetical protein [Bryobacteraceae bacterium]
MRNPRVWIGAAVLSALAGCAVRTARAPAVPDLGKPRADRAFIDLQAGWRVRVITPILKSGGFVVRTPPKQLEGNTLVIDNGGDFIGYETSYYAVTGRRGGGVRVRFRSAEVTRQGKKVKATKPIAQLFRLPRDARYVRLVFLTRASNADHDMAIVAANRVEAIERATKQLQANPKNGCIDEKDFVCSWIPQGIAVRPEIPKISAGVTHWIPAR